MTLFLIFLGLTILITLILFYIYFAYVKTKKVDMVIDTFMGTILSVILPIIIIAGFLVIPMVVNDHQEYYKMIDYEILKGENAVFINYQFDNEKNVVRFDSYKEVTEINDSTYFYLIKYKSFYNNTVRTEIIWSNSELTDIDIKTE